MEEKERRVLDALREVADQGIGEVNVRIEEDGVWLLSIIPWIRNPRESEIQDTVERRKVGFKFKSIEVADGKDVLLKCIKKIKLKV